MWECTPTQIEIANFDKSGHKRILQINNII